MGVKKNIFHHWINFGGFNKYKKFIVFQSDDWGAIRMPSKEIFEILNKKCDLNLDSCPYSLFDTLASANDISLLSDLLLSHKDYKNKHPVFTNNYILANPNFQKIKENDFKQYWYEPLKETYNRKDTEIFTTLFKSIESGVIEPQLHGREHLHVPIYLEMLRNDKLIRECSEKGFYMLSFKNYNHIKFPYLASFYQRDDRDKKNHRKIIKNSVELFKKTFGFFPQSFVAPVYIWNDTIEKELSEYDVKSIQGLYKQKSHKFDRVNNKYSRTNEQINIVRNCFFEPATNKNIDWVNEVLKEIKIAFRMKKPAVISSHRLNYVSNLSIKNRDKNLKLLDKLLSEILNKWPTVEFLATSDLQKLIKLKK